MSSYLWWGKNQSIFMYGQKFSDSRRAVGEQPAKLQDCNFSLIAEMVHFRAVARWFSAVTYGDRSIGQDGPHLRSDRFRDLNPSSFSYEAIYSLIYSNPLENVEDLRNRIFSGNTIRDLPWCIWNETNGHHRW